MPLYEHVYLARQDVSAQQVEDLTKQFTTVIEGLGGKVTKNEYWGVKSLNFRIKKNRKAHFTLLNVDAPPAAIVEIERQERINEDVLRYLTVRVEEFLATGKPPYPVERTLLTGGVLDCALDSRVRGHKRLETPDLDMAYRAPKYSGFLRGDYAG